MPVGLEVERHTSESWLRRRQNQAEEEAAVATTSATAELKPRPATLRIVMDSGEKIVESFDADSTTLLMIKDFISERMIDNRTRKFTLLNPATRTTYTESDHIKTLRMLNLFPNANLIVQRTFTSNGPQTNGEHNNNQGGFPLRMWLLAFILGIMNFFTGLFRWPAMLGSTSLPPRPVPPPSSSSSKTRNIASRTRHLHDLARNQNGDNQYFGGDSTLVSGGDKRKENDTKKENNDDDQGGSGEETKKNN
jgi:hypothetical protein